MRDWLVKCVCEVCECTDEVLTMENLAERLDSNHDHDWPSIVPCQLGEASPGTVIVAVSPINKAVTRNLMPLSRQSMSCAPLGNRIPYVHEVLVQRALPDRC